VAVAPEPIHVRDLLTRTRIRTDLTASSKKSLLDQLAAEFHSDRPDLDEREVFQTLLRREQLGSTAVGHGVALPHGRMSGLDRPIGAFSRLQEPADFDAIDDEPVSLVFALLVPDEQNEQHLQVLSRLARMLDDADFREKLLEASEDALYDLLVNKDEELTGN
jgi:PTS system nitrogen regulatory IIA component